MNEIEQAHAELKAREDALAVREAKYKMLQDDAERVSDLQPDVIKIDVGGTVYKTSRATIRAEDGSLLDGISRTEAHIVPYEIF